ncbi:MAG: helix-turn-helix domain-containing protein [Pirellulales bacterium]
MHGDKSLNLSDREIAQCFSDPVVAAKFPPILTIKEAAQLLSVPVGTLRDWRSRGLLPGCARRLGREVRFFRDRLIKHVFNHGLGQ